MRPVIYSLLMFFVILIGSGCDSDANNIYQPRVIPPPSDIADSLYTVSQSGLKIHDLQLGEGAFAGENNVLEYHYIMWRQDSTIASSTYITGQPQITELSSTSLIPGWVEGLKGMRTGGFRQIEIPPELAFGQTGSSSFGIEPGEIVIMEFGLINVGVQTGN